MPGMAFTEKQTKRPVLRVQAERIHMTEARGMWWCINRHGQLVTYGHRALSPKEHHDGNSTPIVGVQKSPEFPGSIILKTASGSRWIVDDEPAAKSTPGPEWRGLATYLVQLQRKSALLAGCVIGDGAKMTLMQRIAFHK